ncbi:hypothetical protein AGMMS50239_14430 [Bacteroidia bacterium]|nr:hypothetical protein AGMMS50239_14430 [Bacteroidia bacterium]
MRKKILFVLLTIAFSGAATAQSNTTNAGIIINGVRWATCNVEEAGIFADSPESSGKLYQWNRNIAWSATDSPITNWDNTRPEGEEWEKVNDPSPAGWRLPTMAEITSLLDKSKVSNEWTTLNGVNGLKFKDIKTGNSIFLPAAGYRINIEDGKFYEKNGYGHYWSSEQSDGAYAYGLHFDSRKIDYYYYDLYRSDGRCVRPVYCQTAR